MTTGEKTARPSSRTAVKVLVLIVALYALALGTAATIQRLNRPPPSNITQNVQRQIKPGMTRTEVEELVGVPPGNYQGLILDYRPWTGFRVQQDAEIFMAIEGQSERLKWAGEEGVLFVFIATDGRVLGSQWVSWPR